MAACDDGAIGDSHSSSHRDAMTTFAAAATAAAPVSAAVVATNSPITAVRPRSGPYNHYRDGDYCSVRAPHAAITADTSSTTRGTGSTCEATGTASTTTAIARGIGADVSIGSAASRFTTATATPRIAENAGCAQSAIATPATTGLSGSCTHADRNGKRGAE
ncbi:hypothetical protein [Hoeflea alexandrii]|uniref:hypothetical protein n=1 Tax=Hoeflea alexandrii TaxID=288436 RepID=UPI0022AE9907|nr:hypothetical protein [Hoeflea alexandrii]MCZ4291092.1 hypothetical protein [Hoeflea alexandrii]